LAIEHHIQGTEMAGKASFTPEEWARVVASPLVAGMAITAADPSGLWGLLKEAMAGGWSLLDGKQSASANPLAKAVAEDCCDELHHEGDRHCKMPGCSMAGVTRLNKADDPLAQVQRIGHSMSKAGRSTSSPGNLCSSRQML
jgi:hypothetical protein